MLKEIHNKIEEYYNRNKEMPNTVLLPINVYEALKHYSKQMYVSNDNIEQTVFGLNIIAVHNEEDIRVIKTEL